MESSTDMSFNNWRTRPDCKLRSTTSIIDVFRRALASQGPYLQQRGPQNFLWRNEKAARVGVILAAFASRERRTASISLHTHRSG